MAYDRKDGWTYIDDIPLKVASSFLPPPYIVVPSVQTTSDETYFKKFQYDFSFEKKVLQDIKQKEESSIENTSKNGACNGQQESNQEAASGNSSLQSRLPLQSEILLPKPQKTFDKTPNKEEQTNSKINLSDFENETSSPFDYVELQTINDLEELNSVFQGLGNKYSSDNNVNKDKYDSVSESNGAANFSKSMSFPLQNNDTMLETSEKYLTTKETDFQHQSNWSASLTLPQRNSFNPVSTNPTNPGVVISDDGLSRTFITSVLREVPCLPSATAKSRITEDDLSILTSSKSRLRGCKSYSDIHDLSEKCLNISDEHERHSTPQSAFSSEDINVSSSPVQDNKLSPAKVNCDISTLPILPDPYDELPEESRKFVDAVVDMGFLRDQVSRTVKHLGTDEKTVIEHLCQIQNLEECGYDCLEAEAALHLHDYKQDQAKQFLDLINKFQDLGFEKNAVKKALIQNKNDEGKTIDALLS